MSDKERIELQKDKQYIDEIKRKATERSNQARQLRRRQVALERFSWVFNVVSVATAVYFAISITDTYPTLWQFVFAGALISLLALGEVAKRYAIKEVGEGVYMWSAAVALLVGVSFFASYTGGNRFTVEMATPPPIERTGAIDTLNIEIAKVDAEIANWKKQTWRGKLVSDARDGIKRLEGIKAGLIEQRTKLENRDLSNNDERQDEHKAEVQNFGNIFGGVAGAMDFCLIICLLLAKSDEKTARILAGISEVKRPPIPSNAVPVSNATIPDETVTELRSQVERYRNENVTLRGQLDDLKRNVTALRNEALQRYDSQLVEKRNTVTDETVTQSVTKPVTKKKKKRNAKKAKSVTKNCACGCGETVTGRGKYFDDKCRQRAYRARKQNEAKG